MPIGVVTLSRITTLGLLDAKFRRDPQLLDKRRIGMDVAFLVMLCLTGLTGLLFQVFRSTPGMGLLLAVHLGIVFSPFLTMPYGKFMHGIYRFPVRFKASGAA